jgi:hypothetical protein
VENPGELLGTGAKAPVPRNASDAESGASHRQGRSEVGLLFLQLDITPIIVHSRNGLVVGSDGSYGV